MPSFFLPIFALAISPDRLADQLTTNDVQLIVWCLLGLVFIGILNVVSVVLNIIKTSRRDPPLHVMYATKEELKMFRDEVRQNELQLDAKLSEIFGKIDKVSDDVTSLNRALGRVETCEASINEHREATRDRFAEMGKRISNLSTA